MTKGIAKISERKTNVTKKDDKKNGHSNARNRSRKAKESSEGSETHDDIILFLRCQNLTQGP